MQSLFHHLPVLIVAIPLISAPLCVLLRRTFPCWLLSVAVSSFGLFASVQMLGMTQDGSVINYTFGGWQAPWGVAYQVTAANALMAVLINLIALFVILYAKRSAKSEFPAARMELFYTTLLLCLSGLCGVLLSNDLFNIFIFLEIASLSGYVLVAFTPGGQAPLAAFRYLLAGALGATFLLIGIGYLYALTGTLNLDDLAARLPHAEGERAILAAFGFISFGLLIKIALFPLHLWQPDVYTHAPSPVSAWLSATSSKVTLYLLIRLFLQVFAPTTAATPLVTILLVAAAAAIIFGAVTAIGQQNVKRIMAYSSVSQIGYIVLGASLISSDGLRAAFIYLFNHALIKASLFLALGCIICRIGTVNLSQLTGLGRKMPWTAAAITVGGLSLIGVPLTSGFISKWYLVDALLKTSLWPLAAVVLIGSLIAIVYVWRILERIYTPSAEKVTINEAPPVLLLSTWFLIGLNIYLGIKPDALVFVAGTAADALLGGQ